MVILYGDLLFRGYILRDLLDSNAEVTGVVDSAPILAPPSGSPDLAYCSRPDLDRSSPPDIRLLRIASERPAAGVAHSDGFIGMLRVRGAGREWLTEALATLRERPEPPQLSIPDLFNHLVALDRPVQVLYIHGHRLSTHLPTSNGAGVSPAGVPGSSDPNARKASVLPRAAPEAGSDLGWRKAGREWSEGPVDPRRPQRYARYRICGAICGAASDGGQAGPHVGADPGQGVGTPGDDDRGS